MSVQQLFFLCLALRFHGCLLCLSFAEEAVVDRRVDDDDGDDLERSNEWESAGSLSESEDGGGKKSSSSGRGSSGRGRGGGSKSNSTTTSEGSSREADYAVFSDARSAGAGEDYGQRLPLPPPSPL